MPKAGIQLGNIARPTSGMQSCSVATPKTGRQSGSLVMHNKGVLPALEPLGCSAARLPLPASAFAGGSARRPRGSCPADASASLPAPPNGSAGTDPLSLCLLFPYHHHYHHLCSPSSFIA